MFDLVCSLVIYKNKRKQLTDAVNSFLNTNLSVKLILVDNSPTNELKNLTADPRVEYIFNPLNPGFGASHNLVIQEYVDKTKFYLVLNPDIYFSSGVLERLILHLESNGDVGLLMPKILYPNGEVQHLCKLIPSPKDLIFRRFIPFKKIKEGMINKYELRFSSYNEIKEVPILSGCFMMIRMSVLKSVKGFDESFFMYLEDVDICRRIGDLSKVMYYPKIEVVHNYEKGSYKDLRLLMYHIMSGIKYFNKWGWFFDKKRKEINKKVLTSLNYK